jgi:cytoplasmic iron level regulating protein YaaA (DUF328/UPF0246 family)
VFVLLPPSEGKTPRRRGAPVDLSSLSFPELTPAREQVLTALEKTSAGPDSLSVLGVGASLAEEVERNARWRTEPAVPASALYTGVLYDALDFAALPAGAKRRAATRLLVVSAAWGVLRPADRVPPYRLSMDLDLPGVGPLASFWRSRLSAVLDDATHDRLIVDCRSATYAAAWRPPSSERVVPVQVLREVAGRRTVVSHMAKQTRGLVARELMTHSGRDPRTPEQLAALLGDRLGDGFAVELADERGRPVLQIITS